MLGLVPILLAATVAANPLLNRQVSGTSSVNLGNNTGTPAHLASGFIYGIPDAANQIPSSFYTNMGFNYARAGGAQVAAPGRGWIWGLSEYKASNFLSNFKVNILTAVAGQICLCLI